MINKRFNHLSSVMNTICSEQINRSEKSRARHILCRLKGDYVPIYIVVFERTISIISNYNVAVALGDTTSAKVYGVWYDYIGMWHVVEQ